MNVQTENGNRSLSESADSPRSGPEGTNRQKLPQYRNPDPLIPVGFSENRPDLRRAFPRMCKKYFYGVVIWGSLARIIRRTPAGQIQLPGFRAFHTEEMCGAMAINLIEANSHLPITQRDTVLCRNDFCGRPVCPAYWHCFLALPHLQQIHLPPSCLAVVN